MSTPTTPTTSIDPNLKPCDDCDTLAPYEAIELFGTDLGASLPHLCPDCEEARNKAAQEEADKLRIQAMRERWEATVPALYRETDIEHPDFPRDLWQRLRAYPTQSESVGLIGPPGRCKTRVLALLVKRAIHSGLSVGWLRSYQLEETAQKAKNYKTAEEARKLLAHWRTCRVLILDDLGKSPWTSTLETALFDIMEERYSRRSVTHWSLNPLPQDQGAKPTAAILAAALDPTGTASKRPGFEPILERIYSDTLVLTV